MTDTKTHTMCPCGNGTIPETFVDEQSYEKGWKDATDWLIDHLEDIGLDVDPDAEEESQDAMEEKLAELRKK